MGKLSCRHLVLHPLLLFELGEMGILITEDGEVELQTSGSAPASVVLGCGSCSLKIRLAINKTS
jgi:diphthamide biosynthesis protein 4